MKASIISRLLGLSVATVVAAATTAGCSGDPDEPSADPSGPRSTASASPYLPVPDGVELTPPGTHLEVGDHAVVAYKPRQDTVGALDIVVTALEETTIKKSFGAWQLSKEQERSTPYFVRAKVKNVGKSDLGGRPVPLYAVNDQNVLLEATPFASSFQACPSTPFPDKFEPGARAEVCLVYLALDHGTLDAVSFRPDETFDPIFWTGDIEKYQAPRPRKNDNKKR